METKQVFAIAYQHPYFKEGRLMYCYEVQGSVEAYRALNPECAIDDKTGQPLFMTSKPLGLKSQLVEGTNGGVFIQDNELEGINSLITAYASQDTLQTAFVKEAKDLIMNRVKAMHDFWAKHQKGSRPVQSSTPSSQETEDDLGKI
jgi:hypothetical protein